jgi:xanthine dehydrogenase accessory factor
LIEAIAFDASSGLNPPTCFLLDAEKTTLASCGKSSALPLDRQSQFPDLATRPVPTAQSGIAFLPLLARCPLVIVGGGHVGQAVAKLAAELDFRVTVIDDREEFVSEARFPTAERRIAGAFADILPRIEITPATFCLIVTRGHHHDERALYHLVDRGARYVGMIGSKRKIRLIFDDLEAEGIAPELLAKVHAPVGLDIGSQTVPEIAISIAAELIAHRNRNGPGNWGR